MNSNDERSNIADLFFIVAKTEKGDGSAERSYLVPGAPIHFSFFRPLRFVPLLRFVHNHDPQSCNTSALIPLNAFYSPL